MDYRLQTRDIEPEEFALELESLVYFQNILAQEPMQHYIDVLYEIDNGDETQIRLAYSSWNRSLMKNSVNQSWAFWLMEQIVVSDNPFHENMVQNEGWRHALQRELFLLFVAMKLDGAQLSHYIEEESNLNTLPIYDVGQVLPRKPRAYTDAFIRLVQTVWKLEQPDFALWQQYFLANGSGLPSMYPVMYLEEFMLKGLVHWDWVRPEDIFDYNGNFKKLSQHIEHFLKTGEQSHILMNGDRGLGKEDGIKAQLAQFENQGLRLIWIRQDNVPTLPYLFRELQLSPLRFLIFIDDVNFVHDDYAFLEFRHMLEGYSHVLPKNVLFCLSSRVKRFLPIRVEDSSDKDANKISHNFLQHFGLRLNYNAMNEEQYIDTIYQLARIENIKIPPEDLREKAIAHAEKSGQRSIEEARDFVRKVLATAKDS